MRLFLIVSILITLHSFGASKSDSLYVISMEGTGLYKQPSLSSELLDQVPFC